MQVVSNPTDIQSQYPLTTEQFAAKNKVKRLSVSQRYSKTGSYHGVRPLKLASGRTFWPDVVITA